MRSKIVYCLIVAIFQGFSAFGESAEFSVTPETLDQRSFVFSISTSPVQAGVSFHVTIKSKSGAMPSDAKVVLSMIDSTRDATSIEPMKSGPPVELRNDERAWKAEFVAPNYLLKNPDVYLVYEVPAPRGEGASMPSLDFYQIKLRDFLSSY